MFDQATVPFSSGIERESFYFMSQNNPAVTSLDKSTGLRSDLQKQKGKKRRIVERYFIHEPEGYMYLVYSEWEKQTTTKSQQDWS